jgi:Ni,Fe-hydrogenase I large subunit
LSAVHGRVFDAHRPPVIGAVEVTEEHQVDTPTSEVLKEVYAWYGACMYHGQVLEVGLGSLLTALETAKSKAPTRATFDALQANYEKKTLGTLIGKLSSHAILSSDLAEALKNANTKRNHLAHHYFREHFHRTRRQGRRTSDAGLGVRAKITSCKRL